MAHQVPNDKGLLILSCTQDELRILGMPGICDSCNNPNSKEGFYIAVLNWWVCPECFNTWLQRADNYPEDQAIELRHFKKMQTVLNSNLN